VKFFAYIKQVNKDWGKLLVWAPTVHVDRTGKIKSNPTYNNELIILGYSIL
jgi:hypothetical protein